jgi:hypothetical protein
MRQIAVAAVLFAAVAALTVAYPPANQDSAIASCLTDHPINVVQCVDTGTGHHSLMEAIPH